MAINRTSPKKGKVVDIPDAPTIGTATAGIESATVAYTAASKGGPATTYTALSSPGSFTGTGSSSPITVSGLTSGTSYTFTVRGNNATGSGNYSSASNSITALSSPVSFDSIATVELTGNNSYIEFTSIPTTYKHLQIRGIAHGTTAGDQDLYIQVGPSSAQTTGYSWHNIYGSGGGAAGNAAQGGSGANYMVGSWNFVMGTGTPNIFSGMILDILDYSSTTKTKTMHSFAGVDKNGSGIVGSYSGFWYDGTDAIGTIKLYPGGGSFSQYTHFALYGVKG